MLDPWDIREDSFRSGDRYMVRLIHLPTGIKAEAEGEVRRWESVKAEAMARLEDFVSATKES